MTLAAHQQAFCTEIASSDEVASPLTLGMEIYRNAYRGRLVGVLEQAYARTRRWVGEESFAAAASHYVIAHPPSDWTLDRYGADFPAVLAELFARDGEVAELAWLEWHLQQAFAAPDTAELSGTDLAAADLDQAGWERLRLSMAAGYAARAVSHDCALLWASLADEAGGSIAPVSVRAGILIVWRQGLNPRYRLLAGDEFAALGALAHGEAFGTVAARVGGERAEQLGQWFAQWLSDGLFSGLR